METNRSITRSREYQVNTPFSIQQNLTTPLQTDGRNNEENRIPTESLLESSQPPTKKRKIVKSGDKTHLQKLSLKPQEYYIPLTTHGNLLQNSINRKRTFTYENGASYEGDWVNGMKHGLGKLTYADGTVYIGHNG